MDGQCPNSKFLSILTIATQIKCVELLDSNSGMRRSSTHQKSLLFNYSTHPIYVATHYSTDSKTGNFSGNSQLQCPLNDVNYTKIGKM